MGKVVFVRYSKDKYMLPVAVADTADELARMIGKKTGYIYSALWKKNKYIARVEIDLEEEDGER